MTNIAREAAFHRAALLLGIESGADVVAWADHLITERADVPAPVLELSTIPPHDLSELRHALQPLAEGGESVAVVRALFDRVQRELASSRRNAKDTVTVLAQARRFLTLPPHYFDGIDTLQDDFMLAEAGVVGDTATIVKRVHEWLAQFAGAETEFFEDSTC